MNCSGEEQERLLSLLEQEEARNKSPKWPLGDKRNGERLAPCSFVSWLLGVRAPIGLDCHSCLHSKSCFRCSGLLPKNRPQAASDSQTETNPRGECPSVQRAGSLITKTKLLISALTMWQYVSTHCIIFSPYRESWKYLRNTFWASLSLSLTQFTPPASPAGRKSFFHIQRICTS